MRYLLFTLLLMLGLAAFAAQDVGVLYTGGQAMPPGVIFGDWGHVPRPDGVGVFAPVRVADGVFGLRVVSPGKYSGARFACVPGLDVAETLGKPTYAELRLRANQAALAMPALKGLRLTLYGETGSAAVAVSAAQLFPRDEADGLWVRVAIPLIVAPNAVTGKIVRVVLTTDDASEFLLGRFALVRDEAPMSVLASSFPPAPDAGQTFVCTATAQTGLARPEITWDFDARDGIAVDATGSQVTSHYAAPGAYRVTCTVRDTAGWKAPVTTTLEVIVP